MKKTKKYAEPKVRDFPTLEEFKAGIRHAKAHEEDIKELQRLEALESEE